MKIEPIITEKTTAAAEIGEYTFKVDRRLNKFQIRKLIEDVFGVNVVRVRTITTKKEERRTAQGMKKTIKAYKKAIVMLKEKEKIDLFETKKK
jgi:large subunit ribosomal protein L23